MIENSVWRCNELTDLLMNLGKSGSLPLQAVRLIEFIKEIIKGLEPRAAMRGVKFSVITEGPEVQVMAHRLQLFRALSNILVNALEAVPEKTGCVKVRQQREGGSALITVEDNGCGIAPAQLAKVFDPYFTTKKVTGTGLGLFVTKTVIEDIRGSIDIKSVVDKGTLVTIRLPLYEAVS